MDEQIIFYVSEFRLAEDDYSVEAVTEDQNNRKWTIQSNEITQAFYKRVREEGKTIEELLKEANDWISKLRKLDSR